MVAVMPAVRELSADPAPTASWQRLAGELDAWREAGLPATFWWRDDDAVAPTAALTRLRRIAGAAGLPLGLAVIPAKATPELARLVAAWPEATVMPHGFAHANHAAEGRKKAELGADRPAAVVLAELQRGLERLVDLFGERVLPILVPPWNRIAPEVAERLGEAGFAGLSAFGPRVAPRSLPARLNTHVDIIAWRSDRRFVGEALAVEGVRAHLTARRSGAADPAEPTGLLTHHWAHDAACWRFVEELIAITARHPAAHWLSPSTALAGARAKVATAR